MWLLSEYGKKERNKNKISGVSEKLYKNFLEISADAGGVLVYVEWKRAESIGFYSSSNDRV